jgi:hypothetical protein
MLDMFRLKQSGSYLNLMKLQLLNGQHDPHCYHLQNNFTLDSVRHVLIETRWLLLVSDDAAITERSTGSRFKSSMKKT